MAEKKPQDSVIKAIGKSGGYDALVKLGEATLDAFLDQGLVRDIPILGTLVGVGKAGVAVRDVLLIRKLQTFLNEVEDVPEERERFVKEMDADPTRRDKVGTHLIVLLDRFEDMDKARFLGRAFRLFLKREISQEDFRRMARAIDRCLLEDLMIVNQAESARILSNRPHIAVDFVACGLVEEIPQPVVATPNTAVLQLPLYRWTPFGRRFACVVSA